MKISQLTPDQIGQSALTARQRTEVLAELRASGVRPADLGPDHLEAAGVAPGKIPGLLFQVRCAALDGKALEGLRGVSDTLTALAAAGQWGETSSSGNMTYDARVVRSAERLAGIVKSAEEAGAIGWRDKGELDDLVVALLAARKPEPVMLERLPDLDKLTAPRIGEYSSSGMGQRVTLRQGDAPDDVLTLYTFAGGEFVEAGRADGTFSPGGMVALGYLDDANTQKLVGLVDRALAAEPAQGRTRHHGRHPALSAVATSRSAQGFLHEMRRRLVGHGERLVELQTENAAAIRALDPKLERGADGTWFAAQRLEVPSGGSSDYRPGFVTDNSHFYAKHEMIIPEGAELWAEGGRHPGEFVRDRALSGLWVRHEGRCYYIDGEGYPSHMPPELFGKYAWMGRYHRSEPAGFPAHWHAEPEAPREVKRSYPRTAQHEIMRVGLESMTDPVVSLASEGSTRTLTARARRGGEASPTGAIALREAADGTFSLSGWRLESLALGEYDHETLTRLATFAVTLRATAEKAKDRAGAALAARFASAVGAARAKLERDPDTQAMRKLVEAGFDYPEVQLRAFLTRGLTAEDLAKVHDDAKKGVGTADPEVFAARAAELLWPERVVVGRAEVSEAVEKVFRTEKEYLAADAAIAKLLLGASGAERAEIAEQAAAWEKRDRWPALQFRAALTRGLLDPEAATALFTKGKGSSGSDYRATLVKAWASMAAGARTPDEAKRGYDAIAPHLDTRYFDMGGAVLPAAAVLASPSERVDLARRADENLDSQYWAFASAALLTKALCAGSPAEKTAVFERAREELKTTNTLRITICALNAMALTAQTPAEKAETLKSAREYTFGNWRTELRGAALLSMAIVSSDDEVARRAATMANLDL